MMAMGMKIVNVYYINQENHGFFVLFCCFLTPVVSTNSRVAAGIFGQIFVHAEFAKFLLIQILFMNISNNIYRIFPVVYFGKW